MTPAITSAARRRVVVVYGQAPQFGRDRVTWFGVLVQQQDHLNNRSFVMRSRLELPAAHDSARIGFCFAKFA